MSPGRSFGFVSVAGLACSCIGAAHASLGKPFRRDVFLRWEFPFGGAQLASLAIRAAVSVRGAGVSSDNWATPAIGEAMDPSRWEFLCSVASTSVLPYQFESSAIHDLEKGKKRWGIRIKARNCMAKLETIRIPGEGRLKLNDISCYSWLMDPNNGTAGQMLQ